MKLQKERGSFYVLNLRHPRGSCASVYPIQRSTMRGFPSFHLTRSSPQHLAGGSEENQIQSTLKHIRRAKRRVGNVGELRLERTAGGFRGTDGD